MEQTDMTMTVVPKLRLCAAIVGGGAMIALGGIAVYCTQSAEVTASGDAGEAPNSNPQAAIP